MRKYLSAVFSLIILFACACSPVQSDEEMPVNAGDIYREFVVYYEKNGCLVPVSVEAEWNENILNELYAHMSEPASSLEGTGLNSILPEGSEVTATLEDKTASVNINAPAVESLSQSQAENIACAAVNTATQFGGIDGVKLTFNGNCEKLGGVDISNVKTEGLINPAYDIGDLTPFEVFYQLGDTDYIIPVTKAARNIDAQTAVSAMMKKLDGKDVKSLFPEGTKLLSARLENCVLTVDFSKEFLSVKDSPAKEKHLLCGLLSMLKKLDGVDTVVILVEGEEFIPSYEPTSSVFANELVFKDPTDSDI